MSSSEIPSQDSNAPGNAPKQAPCEPPMPEQVGKVVLLNPDLICPSASAVVVKQVVAKSF